MKQPHGGQWPLCDISSGHLQWLQAPRGPEPGLLCPQGWARSTRLSTVATCLQRSPQSGPQDAAGHTEETLCPREWGAMALFGQRGKPRLRESKQLQPGLGGDTVSAGPSLISWALKAGRGYGMHFVSVSPDSLLRESKHFLLFLKRVGTRALMPRWGVLSGAYWRRQGGQVCTPGGEALGPSADASWILLQVGTSHWILTTTPRGRYYYSHFTDGETEAQRSLAGAAQPASDPACTRLSVECVLQHVTLSLSSSSTQPHPWAAKACLRLEALTKPRNGSTGTECTSAMC